MTFNLCIACGSVTPMELWVSWKYDEETDRPVPAPGEATDCERCPACFWLHRDDDSNPGYFQGTLAECESERGQLSDDDHAELWAERWADAAKERAEAEAA